MFSVMIPVPVIEKFAVPVAIKVTDLALIRSLDDYVLDVIKGKLFIVRMSHRFVMMVVRNLQSNQMKQGKNCCVIYQGRNSMKLWFLKGNQRKFTALSKVVILHNKRIITRCFPNWVLLTIDWQVAQVIIRPVETTFEDVFKSDLSESWRFNLSEWTTGESSWILGVLFLGPVSIGIVVGKTLLADLLKWSSDAKCLT
jgi:hypothetical protein